MLKGKHRKPSNRPNKRLTKPFSRNDVKRLISLVHGYPCLWKKVHKDYTDKVVRKAAWERIGNIFGHNPEELYAKWCGLRSTYQRAKANPKVEDVWKFYEDMNFLSGELIEDAQRIGSNNMDDNCEEAFVEEFSETRSESKCNSYSTIGDSNYVEMQNDNSSAFEYEDLNTIASPEATKIEASCQHNFVEMNNIDAAVMLEGKPKKLRKRQKFRVTKPFSENDIQKLISLVHGYPCLWKKVHKYYTNRVVRKATWERISNIIGENQDELCAKWAGLRNQYRKAEATIKANPKVEDVWKFYEDMIFISSEQEDAHRIGSNNNSDDNCEEAFVEELLETRPESICNSYSIIEDSNYVEMQNDNSSVFEYEDLNTIASPEATKIEASCQRNVVEMNNIDAAVMLEGQPKKRYTRPNKRITIPFSGNDIKRLISLVHGYPCLWKKVHKDYKNNVVRKATWERISNIFGKNQDELCAKWAILRSQYRKAIKANPKVEAVWKFYEYMKFLSSEQVEDAHRIGSNNNSDDNCEKPFVKETRPESICSSYSTIGDSNNVQMQDESSSVFEYEDLKTIVSPHATRPESICNSYSTIGDSNNVQMQDENSSVFEYEDLKTIVSPEATKIEASCERNGVTNSVVAVPSAKHAGDGDDDRNLTFVNFLLSELRSLNQQDSNMLRFRLQRALLEFTEERQTQIDIKREI